MRRQQLELLAVGEADSPRDEARAFLAQLYTEKGVPEAFEERWQEVQEEWAATGTYTQTFDELSYGIKLAWRNADRCVGRMYWNAIKVRDCRALTTATEVFGALCEHIELATNGGNLLPVATVFAPRRQGETGWRIWNPQLIRYAGYRQPDGSVLGDPAQLELTERILGLGWDPGPRTPFDVLPLVLQPPGQPPEWFELPPELILEVALVHPDHDWFRDLGLRRYALPAVSDMAGSIGGLFYSLMPFNGWYMDTEIGARNFSDEDRYDMLRPVALRLGLDVRRTQSLWRDRAQLELTRAVVYSFERAGVKLVDHHACSDDFMRFMENEEQAGRQVALRWSWIVPPMGGSATRVFFVDETQHPERNLLPALVPQAPAYGASASPSGCPMHEGGGSSRCPAR